jgi:hypothetical protein
MANKYYYGNGYTSTNSIAIIWSIEDVKQELDEDYPQLKYTDEDCMEVLHSVQDNHDAYYGVSWETIHANIENYWYDELKKLEEQD